jgi:hypothetical protein
VQVKTPAEVAPSVEAMTPAVQVALVAAVEIKETRQWKQVTVWV